MPRRESARGRAVFAGATVLARAGGERPGTGRGGTTLRDGALNALQGTALGPLETDELARIARGLPLNTSRFYDAHGESHLAAGQRAGVLAWRAEFFSTVRPLSLADRRWSPHHSLPPSCADARELIQELVHETGDGRQQQRGGIGEHDSPPTDQRLAAARRGGGRSTTRWRRPSRSAQTRCAHRYPPTSVLQCSATRHPKPLGPSPHTVHTTSCSVTSAVAKAKERLKLSNPNRARLPHSDIRHASTTSGASGHEVIRMGGPGLRLGTAPPDCSRRLSGRARPRPFRSARRAAKSTSAAPRSSPPADTRGASRGVAETRRPIRD